MKKSKIVIDLSKYNTEIEYNKLNVDGVIIRIGYRAYKTGQLKEDSMFKIHISNCITRNIPVGVYFFTTATTPQEGKEEADYTVKLIKDDYKLSFPIFIDTEMSNNDHNGRSDKLNKDQRTAAVVAFCERIKELGYTPGIYASDSWFVTQLNYSKVKDYKLWVASYSRTPYRVSKYIAWQYTSSNTGIPGIKDKVDTSYWYDSIGDEEAVDFNTNPYLRPSSVLKRGVKGEAVKWLQWELNERGYKLKVDGIFRSATLKAVRDYQKINQLKVDGIVGPITIASLCSNSDIAPTLSVNAAIYSSNSEIDENKKYKLKEGEKIIVTGVNMYLTIFTLFPYKLIHGECEILKVSSIFGCIKVKVKRNDPEKVYIGWFLLGDIIDLFDF